VERDIADGIGFGQLVSEFALIPRKLCKLNLSYSRPNNFCGFNANSETSCIFVAVAKQLICAFV